MTLPFRDRVAWFAGRQRATAGYGSSRAARQDS
jgi:hypothetical protein